MQIVLVAEIRNPHVLNGCFAQYCDFRWRAELSEGMGILRMSHLVTQRSDFPFPSEPLHSLKDYSEAAIRPGHRELPSLVGECSGSFFGGVPLLPNLDNLKALRAGWCAAELIARRTNSR